MFPVVTGRDADTRTPPTLTLYSWGLLSKWGFGDGEAPEHLLDWWDDNEPDISYASVNWHPVLRRLVRERLLPELHKHHVIDVYDIETIHNPIRDSTVDGQAVDDYASRHSIELIPSEVTVPYDVVTAAVREVGL